MGLTKKQIDEVRKHLKKAQNPLFLFDNDQDGLCSFLILQRYIGRGKGFPIKVSPELTVEYFRKVVELEADYIFILDQPEVSSEFFEEVQKVNIPVVWIDHHKIEKKKIPSFINYYNPLFNRGKKEEPVTFLCQQIADRKKDLWLAVIGCISDAFYPDFYEDFKKEYPEISMDSKEPFNIFYGSEIGKAAKILGSSLKDRTTNVITMLKLLMKSKGPYDVLKENPKNKFMHKRFEEINKKYLKFIEKAKKLNDSKKLVFFKYASDISMSADLANGLKFNFPKKLIVVVHTKGPKANISARGENARKIILKAIKPLKDSTGGGHEKAVGAQIKLEEVSSFEENLRKLI